MDIKTFEKAENNRRNFKILKDIREALNKRSKKMVIGDVEINLESTSSAKRVHEVLDTFEKTISDELAILNKELESL